MIYLALLFILFGFLAGFEDFYAVGVFSSLFAWCILYRNVYSKVGLFSLTSLFLLFFLLYGYSVPLSILFDLNIGEYRKNYIFEWDKVDSTLMLFSLANNIALLGIYLVWIWRQSLSLQWSSLLKLKQAVSVVRIERMFIVSLLLSFLFELINFIRAGAYAKLFQGKLLYQSSLADMGMLLPSELFFYISTILLAWLVKIKYLKTRNVVYYFVFNFFYLSNNLIIGERGVLVNSLLMFLLVYFWDFSIKKIKSNTVFVLISAYLVFVGLTVSRNFFDDKRNLFTVLNIINYTKSNKETFEFVLNPANSEFCTSALNFRVYSKENIGQNYEYGLTYLHVFTQLLPRAINPFYSPSITIQFRDRYFKERGENGSTGGTGYSSLMESYINFGLLGPFLIYGLVFGLLLYLENLRKINNTSISLVILYALFFELVLLFNRSALEYIIVKLFTYFVVISFLLVISKIQIKR